MIHLTQAGIEKVRMNVPTEDVAKGIEQMERLGLSDTARCVTVPFVRYVHFEEGVDYERDKATAPKPVIESELKWDERRESFKVDCEDVWKKRRAIQDQLTDPFGATVRFKFPAMTLYGMKIER
jgi:hypothetical protein